MAHPYVPPMLEVLADTFNAFPADSPIINPLERRNILRAKVAAAAADTIHDGLLNAAMKSLGFCAFSNYAKARKVFEQPASATRNSTDILKVATLTHRGEQLIQIEDVTNDLELGTDGLFPEMLVPVDEPEPHLILHEYYDKKLAIMRMPGRGCPAYGAVLNNMYRRYVDVVFAPVLEQEAAASTPVVV